MKITTFAKWRSMKDFCDGKEADLREYFEHKGGPVGRLMPALIGVIIAIGLASTTLGAVFVIASIAMTLLSIGMAIITKLTQGKPSAAHVPITSQASVRQPISFHRVAYGNVQVGGVFTFIIATATGGKPNNALEPVITLTGHKIHALDKVIFDGVQQANSGNVLWEMSLGDPFFTGQPFPNLVTNSNGYWTADHRQQGRAAAHLQLTWDDTQFPNGMPQNIAFNIRGKECYDPRQKVAFSAFSITSNKVTLTGPGTSSSPAFQLSHDGVGHSTVLVEGLASPNDYLNGIWQVDSVASGSIVLKLAFNLATGVAKAFSHANVGSTSAVGSATQLRYTSNPAICLLDYLMAGVYGMAVPLTLIDMTACIAAANTCDEQVDIRSTNLGPLAITACASASGTTTTYQTTFAEGNYNGLKGKTITVTGFTAHAAANNGVFLCTGSHTSYDGDFNVTEQTVTLANPNGIAETASASGAVAAMTENRYTCNGCFDVSGPRADAIKSILQSMGGYLVAPGDRWRMYAASYKTPTVTLTDDDFRDTLKLQVRSSRSALFNNVRGTYVSEANNFATSNYPSQPPVANTTYQTEDGELIWDDFQLDFTNSPTMAQRLARIHLERSRRQMMLTAPCKLTAYQVQSGEVVQITHSRFGWTNKTFEVMQVDLVAAKGKAATAGGVPEADGLGVDLLLRETHADVYTWDPDVDENIVDEPNVPLLPSTSAVAAVSGMSLVADSTTDTTRVDGIRHARIHVSWSQHTDQFLLSGGFIEIWYKKTASSTYILKGRAAGQDTEYYISPVNDGVSYDVQLIAVNTHGAHSSAVTGTITPVSGVSAISMDILLDGDIYVRGTQMVSGYLALDNGNFEASGAMSSTGFPPGWMALGTGVTPSYETSTQQAHKNRALKLVCTSSGTGAQSVKVWRAQAGEVWKIAADMKTSGGAIAQADIDYYDKSGNLLSSAIATTTSASWVNKTATLTVPANTVYCRISCGCWSGGGGTVWFDNVIPTKVHSLEDEVSDGTKRKATAVGLLAARPAAGTAGALYHATDQGTNGTTYRDTGAVWTKVGVGHLGDADGNLDSVGDGSTYARPLATRINAGKPVIDFNESIHSNKNIDSIADGSTRKAVTSIDAAGKALIDFSQTHSNKTIDNVPNGSTRKAVTSIDAAGKALVDFSQAGHTNKTIDSVGDGTSFHRTTPNQVTGAGLAFTNINSDNTYDTLAYHSSAFRQKSTTTKSGLTTTQGSYVTVASFVLHIPSGYTQYKGTLTVTLTKTDDLTWTCNGRINVGAHNSNVITFSQPTLTANGTVTLTGLTPDTDITVNVQVNFTTDGSVPKCTGSFAQNTYVDQDTSNLS